jgi:KipI family sensor histidine kinase inhibitor
MKAFGAQGRRVATMGEAAGLVFTSGSDESQALAAALRASPCPGLEDIVPAADSVGVLVDPETIPVEAVLELAAGLWVTGLASEPKGIDVEVCFDGPDLAGVADAAHTAAGDLVASLEAATLTVGWLGFMPGFPYLLGLPAPLRSVPRFVRPRAKVAAGAFAIANGYAGIYPATSPGGWSVLGRTGFTMFDAARATPATLAPGDVVRLRSVDAVTELEPPHRAPVRATGARRLLVVDTGVMTLVEDGGRIGVAHLGVPRAGPADPLRHAIANVAVGNAEGAAALEITAGGARLRFGCDAFVALVGDGPMHVDGRETPPSTTQLVEQGQTVVIGALRTGLRAYLGIGGGLELPAQLGSRSSDAVSGIWPGPLRSGDELDLGTPGLARGRWFEPAAEHPAVLQLCPGPDEAGGESFAALVDSCWEVAGDSNRMGTRLRRVSGGRESAVADEANRASPLFPSRATVVGAVQLPPDGGPLVLGPDHGTVGGYPVVAVLRRPSLSAAGQLRQGDVVVFEESHGFANTSVVSVARRSVTGWMGGAAGS